MERLDEACKTTRVAQQSAVVAQAAMVKAQALVIEAQDRVSQSLAKEVRLHRQNRHLPPIHSTLHELTAPYNTDVR